MEPDAIAYAEAIRALDQQRGQLDSLRTRASATFVVAAIVSSSFAGFAIDPKQGLNGAQWVAVAFLVGVLASTLLILWPWNCWKWIPPAKELVRDYVDGDSRATGLETQRDLALILGQNYEHNQAPLARLYRLQMFGIICVAASVVAWTITI